VLVLFCPSRRTLKPSGSKLKPPPGAKQAREAGFSCERGGSAPRGDCFKFTNTIQGDYRIRRPVFYLRKGESDMAKGKGKKKNKKKGKKKGKKKK